MKTVQSELSSTALSSLVKEIAGILMITKISVKCGLCKYHEDAITALTNLLRPILQENNPPIRDKQGKEAAQFSERALAYMKASPFIRLCCDV